jgi:hypothetical protein
MNFFELGRQQIEIWHSVYEKYLRFNVLKLTFEKNDLNLTSKYLSNLDPVEIDKMSYFL